MAVRSLGQLTIDLIMKTGGFVQGWTAAEREADRAQKKIAADAKKRAKETEEAWKEAGSTIGTALTAGFTALATGAFTQKFIEETVNAQNEQALLASALKATGEQAGFSQGRLNDMAGAMEGLTNFSAGEFNQAQTVLLGFTNIAGEQLPEALKRAADFAQRTGVSMKSAAETIGRALDVPSAGMVSLQRQGFKFAESQIEAAKRLEETGRVAEAQQIVLKALDETYGGAAEAARDTLGGALANLKNTFNSVMTGDDGSVNGLKVAVNDLANTLASDHVRAAFQTIIGWIADLASAAATAVGHIATFGQFVGESLAKAVHGSADPIERLDENIKSTSIELKGLNDELARTSKFSSGKGYDSRAELTKRRDDLQKQVDGMKKAQADLIRAANNVLPSTPTLGPDLKPRTVGPIKLDDVAKAGRKAGGGKSQAERDAEAAEKYIQALREEADGRKKLTAVERLSYDLAAGKVKMNERQLALAQGQATAIDMAKEAEESRAESMLRATAQFEAQERLLGKSAEYTALLSAYGQGDKQNAVLRERVSLLQSQQAELRKMAQDQAVAASAAKDEDELQRLKARYEARLQIVRETQAQELQMFDQFQSMKKEKDGDWLLGAQSAISTYIEKTQDAYANARDATTSMMQTIEGAFVNLFTLGEASFKGFASSILKGIAQIAAQQAASGIAGFLGRALGSLIGGGVGGMGAGTSANSILNTGIKFGGMRAGGGNVDPGSLYRVNELGPELLNMGGKDYLMMGGSGGYVKPLGAADTERRGAGNITVVNQTTGRVDNVEQRQLTHDDVVLIIQEQTPKVMVSQSQNANSPFSRTMQGSFNVSRRR